MYVNCEYKHQTDYKCITYLDGEIDTYYRDIIN